MVWFQFKMKETKCGWIFNLYLLDLLRFVRLNFWSDPGKLFAQVGMEFKELSLNWIWHLFELKLLIWLEVFKGVFREDVICGGVFGWMR